MNLKKLIIIAVTLIAIADNTFAKTKVEGLSLDKNQFDYIEVIISGNDAKKEIITINPVTNLTISEANQVGAE